MVIAKKFAYKRKTYKKKMKKPIVSSKLKSAIKRVVRGTIEPRQTTLLTGNSVTAVTHRSFYYCTPLNSILVGTLDGNRIGSQTFVKALKLKIMFNRNSSFFDDIRVRIMCFYAPTNETDWNEVSQTTWAGATTTMIDNVFQAEGSGLETVNTEVLGLKRLYDKSIILRSNNYGAVTSSITKTAKPYDIYIPINKNVKYRSIGTATMPHQQIFLAMYFYGGGLISTDLTNLLGFSSYYTIYHRDI